MTHKYRKYGTKAKWWWFLLKGEVLGELEGQWNSIELQTRWKLEPCFKPTSPPDAEEDNQLQPPNCTDQDNSAQPPPADTETGGECNNSKSSSVSLSADLHSDTGTTANPTNSSDIQAPASHST